MPVSPNNLQFSLSSDYLERLKGKANPGESLGLTAKRLLIELLKGDRSPESPSSPSPDLTALTDRLTALEADRQDLAALTDRLTAIESAVAELRSHIGAATSPVKRPASPPPPKRKGRSSKI